MEIYYAKEAVDSMLEKAKAGDTEIQYSLALGYESGSVGEVNQKKAIYWYEKAAVCGHVDAQINLACCYQRGEGVFPDMDKAAYWFEKAAIQGAADAQLSLGLYYFHGDGANKEKDYEKAFYWFMKAAKQKNLTAMHNVAICYYNGHGVERDLTSAMMWLEESSNLGNEESLKLFKYLMGGMLFDESNYVKSGVESYDLKLKKVIDDMDKSLDFTLSDKVQSMSGNRRFYNNTFKPQGEHLINIIFDDKNIKSDDEIRYATIAAKMYLDMGRALTNSLDIDLAVSCLEKAKIYACKGNDESIKETIREIWKKIDAYKEKSSGRTNEESDKHRSSSEEFIRYKIADYDMKLKEVIDDMKRSLDFTSGYNKRLESKNYTFYYSAFKPYAEVVIEHIFDDSDITGENEIRYATIATKMYIDMGNALASSLDFKLADLCLEKAKLYAGKSNSKVLKETVNEVCNKFINAKLEHYNISLREFMCKAKSSVDFFAAGFAYPDSENYKFYNNFFKRYVETLIEDIFSDKDITEDDKKKYITIIIKLYFDMANALAHSLDVELSRYCIQKTKYYASKSDNFIKNEVDNLCDRVETYIQIASCKADDDDNSCDDIDYDTFNIMPEEINTRLLVAYCDKRLRSLINDMKTSLDFKMVDNIQSMSENCRFYNYIFIPRVAHLIDIIFDEAYISRNEEMNYATIITNIYLNMGRALVNSFDIELSFACIERAIEYAVISDNQSVKKRVCDVCNKIYVHFYERSGENEYVHNNEADKVNLTLENAIARLKVAYYDMRFKELIGDMEKSLESTLVDNPESMSRNSRFHNDSFNIQVESLVNIIFKDLDITEEDKSIYANIVAKVYLDRAYALINSSDIELADFYLENARSHICKNNSKFTEEQKSDLCNKVVTYAQKLWSKKYDEYDNLDVILKETSSDMSIEDYNKILKKIRENVEKSLDFTLMDDAELMSKNRLFYRTFFQPYADIFMEYIYSKISDIKSRKDKESILTIIVEIYVDMADALGSSLDLDMSTVCIDKVRGYAYKSDITHLIVKVNDIDNKINKSSRINRWKTRIYNKSKLKEYDMIVEKIKNGVERTVDYREIDRFLRESILDNKSIPTVKKEVYRSRAGKTFLNITRILLELNDFKGAEFCLEKAKEYSLNNRSNEINDLESDIDKRKMELFNKSDNKLKSDNPSEKKGDDSSSCLGCLIALVIIGIILYFIFR